MCEYLFERIKREVRSKTIQQSAYLLIKGLIKKKTNNSGMLFNVLDDLFDIPKEKTKPQKTEEELIDDLENYIKGV